jgi:hypothetical protein
MPVRISADMPEIRTSQRSCSSKKRTGFPRISNTTNRGGLVVRARLDRRNYPIDKKVSAQELRELKIENVVAPMSGATSPDGSSPATHVLVSDQLVAQGDGLRIRPRSAAHDAQAQGESQARPLPQPDADSGGITLNPSIVCSSRRPSAEGLGLLPGALDLFGVLAARIVTAAVSRPRLSRRSADLPVRTRRSQAAINSGRGYLVLHGRKRISRQLLKQLDDMRRISSSSTSSALS